jgi:hypothetical protein
LRTLVAASLALEPDVLVVFAGNNWGPLNGLDDGQQRRLVDLLGDPQSWADARALLEQHLRSQVETLFGELGGLCRRVPVVFVLPAFNLADWHSPDALPLLDKPAVRTWRAELGEAERALDRGDTVTAERHARALMALDQGTVGRPFEILAACMKAAGRTAERRQALELARDSEFLFSRASTPRCFGVTTDAIRHHAAAQRVALVDLPLRFQDCATDGVTGRHAFLDYCHLTSDGIQIAMASIAEAVLDACGAGRVSWTELRDAAPAPAPPTAALARLFAAHHNCVLEQPQRLIEHHCREALRLDAGVADAMADLIELQIRRQPMVLCSAFQRFRLVAGGALDRYCDPTGGASFPNAALAQAAIDALRPLAPAIARRLDGLSRSEHTSRRQTVSLLEKRYWRTGFLRVPLWTQLEYYRAHGQVCEFALPPNQSSALRVVLTTRLGPNTNAGEDIEVRINGCHVQSVPASQTWQTNAFVIAPERIAREYNVISILWPIPDRAWNDELLEQTQWGEAELQPVQYPIFGEIARFDLEAYPETSVGEVEAHHLVHDAHQ